MPDAPDAGESQAPPGALPTKAKLERNLKDALDAVRAVPLRNKDAPDLPLGCSPALGKRR
jgi:hypothetical protein